MEKEDEKRNEIFYNEILAPDEIDRLLEPKVLTNFKRIDKNGETPLSHSRESGNLFHTDKNGDIKDNLIIKGNNLLALYSLKKRFAGKVKLIYIDPPYNTGNDSFLYNDSFNHSSWLTFMRNRLEVAKVLLKEDGVITISINDNESAYLKILCDEVFGRANYLNTLIWYYSAMSSYPDKKFRNACEHILLYCKNINSYKGHNKNEKEVKLKFRNVIETVKRIIDNNNLNQSLESIGVYFDEEAQSYYSWYQQTKDIRVKDFFLTSYDDVIYSPAVNRNARERVKGFNGQKPEELIRKIISFFSSENDLIFDFHLGTGTTAAVAHKMGRQYIGVEQLDYGENDCVVRLKNVINGDQSGISKSVNWQGGGDFVYCELMKLNEKHIDEINKAKTTKELLDIWNIMKEKAFLSYKVDVKQFDDNVKEFEQLSLENQKKFLIECLDKNQLYVNLSEIDDVEYEISKEDKELNKQFYETK